MASLLSAVAWVTVGRDSKERRDREESVPVLLLCAGIDIKVKTTFFGLFLWFFFGTFSLSAPWVICHVRLSEVRERWRGARRGQLVLCGDLLGRVLHKFELFRISSLKT